MEIVKKREGDKLTLALSGRLDTLTAPQLEAVSKIGSMSLSNVCDDIKEVLTITGFADIFTIK